MAPVRELDEKRIVASHKVSKILKLLQSKLLLIISLVNFAIQLPLHIQVSSINHNLDASLSPESIKAFCNVDVTVSVFNSLEPDVQASLNHSNDEIVTLIYSQFAILFMVMVASINESFSRFLALCGFIVIQIIWEITQVTETISFKKTLNDDFGCSSLLDSKRLAMQGASLGLQILFLAIIILFFWRVPKLLSHARMLMRNQALMLVNAAENLLYISAYLWIGLSLLFAADMLSIMSVSVVFVALSLSVAWFRLGWLTIHQRSRADPIVFFLIGITVILFIGTSGLAFKALSTWSFFVASWVLSVVLAIFTHVAVMLAMWYTRRHGDHIELHDESEEPALPTFVSRRPDVEPSQIVTEAAPPVLPPQSTRPDIIRFTANPIPTSSVSASVSEYSFSSSAPTARAVLNGNVLPSSPPPPPNRSTRPATLSRRPNGLAQTSVMRRPSERRPGQSSTTAERPANENVNQSPPTPSLTLSENTTTTTSPSPPVTISPPPPPPPPLVIPLPPALPRLSLGPSISVSRPDEPSTSSRSTFIPPPPPPPPSTQISQNVSDSTNSGPSSFRYSSLRRPPPDEPISPTRRDTLASEYTIDTLPSYRSRATTPIATEPPHSFNVPVPPMPPLPQYPALPSGPAQFLARRATMRSSVGTYATLPSYRSPTVSGSETGSEVGDSTSTDDGETSRREEQRMPIGAGRRSSQRSIVSMPRSVRR